MQHGLILHTIRYKHYSYWKCTCTFHTVDHGNNFTNNRVQNKWPSKCDMHILTTYMYIHVHTYLHVHERHTHTGSTIRTNTRLRTSAGSLDGSLERSDRSCDITTSFSTTVCSRSLICWVSCACCWSQYCLLSSCLSWAAGGYNDICHMWSHKMKGTDTAICITTCLGLPTQQYHSSRLSYIALLQQWLHRSKGIECHSYPTCDKIVNTQ